MSTTTVQLLSPLMRPSVLPPPVASAPFGGIRPAPHETQKSPIFYWGSSRSKNGQWGVGGGTTRPGLTDGGILKALAKKKVYLSRVFRLSSHRRSKDIQDSSKKSRLFFKNYRKSYYKWDFGTKKSKNKIVDFQKIKEILL